MIITAKQHYKSSFGRIWAYLFALILFFQAAPVLAGDTLLDIFFLPHRPALAVVSEVEKIAAEFNNIVIKKHNFEEPATKKLLKKYSITSHMPVAIFINGRNTFAVKDKKVSLRNFPKGNAFVPMFAGEWEYEDLRTILQQVGRGK